MQTAQKAQLCPKLRFPGEGARGSHSRHYLELFFAETFSVKKSKFPKFVSRPKYWRGTFNPFFHFQTFRTSKKSWKSQGSGRSGRSAKSSRSAKSAKSSKSGRSYRSSSSKRSSKSAKSGRSKSSDTMSQHSFYLTDSQSVTGIPGATMMGSTEVLKKSQKLIFSIFSIFTCFFLPLISFQFQALESPTPPEQVLPLPQDPVTLDQVLEAD